MTSEHKPILTNVGVYRSIADAAYRKMSEDMGENVAPKADDSPGVVKIFDPEQTSFKQAMIATVFTCIWLEAALHLLIVDKYGRNCFREVDKDTYETKLELLGCGDEELLMKVVRLRRVRRELVHEKAHFEFNDRGEFTGALRTTQEEAENARAVMVGVEKWISLAD